MEKTVELRSISQSLMRKMHISRKYFEKSYQHTQSSRINLDEENIKTFGETLLTVFHEKNLTFGMRSYWRHKCFEVRHTETLKHKCMPT